MGEVKCEGGQGGKNRSSRGMEYPEEKGNTH